jgi:hypothetical protein
LQCDRPVKSAIADGARRPVDRHITVDMEIHVFVQKKALNA